jgi:pSer/pThr/pTyr-binding forkhead associated (FHA) protein
MFAQLFVIAGPDRGQIFPLRPGPPLVIGRGRQTATRLNDPHVSRVHCEVELRGEAIVLKDLNSFSGTFVNGQAVTEQVLREADVIRIGTTELRLEHEDVSEQHPVPPKDSAAVPVEQVPAEAPSGGEQTSARSQRRRTSLLPEPDAASSRAKAKPPAPRSKKRRRPELPLDRLGELSGSRLSHFQLGPLLGQGKIGTVFRATDLDDNRTVALKILAPEFTRNEKHMKRFMRAMKTMMRLRHLNLVSLHSAGRKGAYSWIAMEYVDGESLAQVIQRIGIAGMLDWRYAFRVAVHVGRALVFAHDRDILHRNLTPQNVLIRGSDKLVKLGDLLLAKATAGRMAEEITGSAEMLGDIRYLSPEQTFGQGVDSRSDLYSLGALLYAVLTGQPPFTGATMVETVSKIRNAVPEKPRKYQMAIPEDFQSLVLKLLAKRPEERFQTAEEMLNELTRIGRCQGVGV